MKIVIGILRDLVGVAGAAAIVYGVAQIYRPGAFIIGGIMALVAAVLAALAERRAARPPTKQ